MALDFPDSPVDGEIFAGYTYNSAVGVWRAPSRETLSGLSDVTNMIRQSGASLQYYNSKWQVGYDYKIIDIIRVFGTTSASVTQNFSIGDYPGATALYIQTQAGGGGGGGAAATTTSNAVGGSGGAGEYSELFLDITSETWLWDVASQYNSGYNGPLDRIPTTIVMQAGRGGPGGLGANAGTAGADSYFWLDDKVVSDNQDYWCGAEGGSGGALGTSLTTNRFLVGGGGGNDPTTGADINITSFSIPGSSGEAVMILGATTVNVAHSGRGGASVNSAGAISAVLNVAGKASGEDASGYGGGGSGAVNTGSQTATSGGAGSPGFVFVYVLG